MNPDSDEGDDWTKYADTGYTSTYDPWADMVPITENEEEEFDDDFDDLGDSNLRGRDIPRCPAPAGIEHTIQIGTCNHCLGRVAGVRIAGDPLDVVGERIRTQALERDPDLKVNADADCCPFCEDLFLDLDLIVNRISAEVEGVEFTKAQLGIHFSKDHVAAEEVLRSTIAATGSRPLKATLSEAVQSAFSEKSPGVTWVKEKPELMLLFDTLTLGVNADIRALFLYGRYRKLARGIPQTRWPCRACRGRDGGCESCNGTGQQYPHSIQSLVCEPMVDATNAASDSFHGMGREDIDVHCLGDGRPFVAELKSPLLRTIDLDKLTKKINKAAKGQIEIHGLRHQIELKLPGSKKPRLRNHIPFVSIVKTRYQMKILQPGFNHYRVRFLSSKHPSVLHTDVPTRFASERLSQSRISSSKITRFNLMSDVNLALMSKSWFTVTKVGQIHRSLAS